MPSPQPEDSPSYSEETGGDIRVLSWIGIEIRALTWPISLVLWQANAAIWSAEKGFLDFGGGKAHFVRLRVYLA